WDRRAAQRGRRAGRPASRTGALQRDLRGHRQAHPTSADRGSALDLSPSRGRQIRPLLYPGSTHTPDQSVRPTSGLRQKLGRTTMRQDRRTFLRTAGVVGATAVAANTLVHPAAAQNARTANGSKEMPKGMTFATLRRSDGYGLGLRTDRGILDVTTAEKA